MSSSAVQTSLLHRNPLHILDLLAAAPDSQDAIMPPQYVKPPAVLAATCSCIPPALQSQHRDWVQYACALREACSSSYVSAALQLSILQKKSPANQQEKRLLRRTLNCSWTSAYSSASAVRASSTAATGVFLPLVCTCCSVSTEPLCSGLCRQVTACFERNKGTARAP